MKKKTPKKSVSFPEAVTGPSDELKAIEICFPGDKGSLFAIPFHLPLVLYGMIQGELMVDPLKGLWKGVINLLLMQLVYGVILAKSILADSAKPQGPNVFFLVVASTVLSLLLSGILFVGLILFGAPLYDFVKETFALAVHLSVLLLQPSMIAFKLDFQNLGRVFESESIYKTILHNQVLCGAFFTFIGTWFGVVPIPLDWDRPWQQWPITLLAGGYMGAFLGSVLGLILSKLESRSSSTLQARD